MDPKILADAPLGKQVPCQQDYDPGLLFSLPRPELWRDYGLSQSPFQDAWDIWTAWELSWLNTRGLPRVAVAALRFPGRSPRLIESKSLKLYLFSLNQRRFVDREELARTIEEDIGAQVGVPIQVGWSEATPPAAAGDDAQGDGGSIEVSWYDGEDLALMAAGPAPDAAPSDLDPEFDDDPERDSVDHTIRVSWHDEDRPFSSAGTSLDGQDVNVDVYDHSPELLAARSDAPPVTEGLYSHLLRCACPITGQPDWASVHIWYRGPPIDHAALLRYIVSFRNHSDFAEQCAETIFLDILQRCKPTSLSVCCRYLRRGGLDINPCRSNERGIAWPLRQSRQ